MGGWAIRCGMERVVVGGKKDDCEGTCRCWSGVDVELWGVGRADGWRS